MWRDIIKSAKVLETWLMQNERIYEPLLKRKTIIAIRTDHYKQYSHYENSDVDKSKCVERLNVDNETCDAHLTLMCIPDSCAEEVESIDRLEGKVQCTRYVSSNLENYIVAGSKCFGSTNDVWDKYNQINDTSAKTVNQRETPDIVVDYMNFGQSTDDDGFNWNNIVCRRYSKANAETGKLSTKSEFVDIDHVTNSVSYVYGNKNYRSRVLNVILLNRTNDVLFCFQNVTQAGVVIEHCHDNYLPMHHTEPDYLNPKTVPTMKSPIYDEVYEPMAKSARIYENVPFGNDTETSTDTDSSYTSDDGTIYEDIETDGQIEHWNEMMMPRNHGQGEPIYTNIEFRRKTMPDLVNRAPNPTPTQPLDLTMATTAPVKPP